jgi:peroxiredoxin
MERKFTEFKLKLGDKIPYFSLPGTDGKLYTISEFEDAKCLVVVFTCNHCPYARAYEERLIALSKDFSPKGVQFIAICSNDSVSYPEDSFEKMVEKSKTLNLPYPYLQDETQITAHAFDAACTPECYVFDSKHTLQYHGRVDDNHEDQARVKNHELRMAIESVLQNSTPIFPLTPALGCSIKWKRTTSRVNATLSS